MRCAFVRVEEIAKLCPDDCSLDRQLSVQYFSITWTGLSDQFEKEKNEREREKERKRERKREFFLVNEGVIELMLNCA